MRESGNAKAAFEDYLLLGPDRSLRELIERYKEQKQNQSENQSENRSGEGPPTVQLSTLKEWSRQHSWQARIAEIDAEQQILVRQELAQRLADLRKPVVDALEKQARIAVDMWEQAEASPIKIDSPRAFQQAVQGTATVAKMIMGMAGEPIPERVEHTGPDGSPIQQIGFQGTPEAFARALQALAANEPELAGEIISDMAVESTIKHIGQLLPADSEEDGDNAID